MAGGREWSPTRLTSQPLGGSPRGEVRGLRLVDEDEHLQIWNELMLREHLQEAHWWPVRCENLASQSGCALAKISSVAMACGCLRFVEVPHDGACYKAANWIHVGQTKGRGRNGARDAGKSRKDIYLYPLVEQVRQRMGVQPAPVEALDAASGLEAAGWAEQEFGACELGDPRRTRRLVKIVSDQAAQPSGSYSSGQRRQPPRS